MQIKQNKVTVGHMPNWNSERYYLKEKVLGYVKNSFWHKAKVNINVAEIAKIIVLLKLSKCEVLFLIIEKTYQVFSHSFVWVPAISEYGWL